jgi:hypothetical protein
VFSTTIELFGKYLRDVIDRDRQIIVDAHTPQHNLAVEVLDRLRQLQFIVRRLKELEHPFNSLTHNDVIYAEARVLTDAFYYLAFRTRIALQSLPKLESFECVPVRDVRNHLLEHPEGGNSNLVNLSFGWLRPGGPVIKPVRYAGQQGKFADIGLFSAAENFQIKLDTLLTVSLGEIVA